MRIYHYGHDGVFMGQGLADPDPLNPGQYLLPALATTVAPPQAGQNQIPAWDDQGWRLIPDFRGQKGWRVDGGEEVTIAAAGPWPAELAEKPSPGPAHTWNGTGWVYNIRLDSPGPDYDFDEDRQAWIRHRYSKLAFFNLFTMAEKIKFKAVIAGGNMIADVINDSLRMAEFIDVRDPETARAVMGLASAEGGLVITPERAAKILEGQHHAPEN